MSEQEQMERQYNRRLEEVEHEYERALQTVADEAVTAE